MPITLIFFKAYPTFTQYGFQPQGNDAIMVEYSS